MRQVNAFMHLLDVNLKTKPVKRDIVLISFELTTGLSTLLSWILNISRVQGCLPFPEYSSAYNLLQLTDQFVKF
jgi:hypothetical protein